MFLFEWLFCCFQELLNCFSLFLTMTIKSLSPSDDGGKTEWQPHMIHLEMLWSELFSPGQSISAQIVFLVMGWVPPPCCQWPGKQYQKTISWCPSFTLSVKLLSTDSQYGLNYKLMLILFCKSFFYCRNRLKVACYTDFRAYFHFGLQWSSLTPLFILKTLQKQHI